MWRCPDTVELTHDGLFLLTAYPRSWLSLEASGIVGRLSLLPPVVIVSESCRRMRWKRQRYEASTA